ncbi:excalibur calcium-binding domain-containing protein [Aeromonas sp. S19(2024)]|uniref:excalibur calcium-binding domain-containing protein n=1 Tax=Aeromonas sp. S19(2024) TaxID=3242892 RepID=UPI00352871FE
MRYQGRIASWNSQRGFGFIKQEQGGAVQVFFPDRPLSLAGGPMPSMPDRGSREDLSPRAPHATTYRTREYHAPRRKGSWGGKLIPLLVLAGLFSLYSRFSAEFASLPSFPSFSQEDSTSNSTVQVPTFVRQCDGRQHCSQMTSCEEATWFLQNCPNTKMDGEGDGIPCERQWCGH